MRYGIVVKFNTRGFGFIRPYFGPDVFFHVSALGACKPIRDIPVGQPVKYELVPDTELKKTPKRRTDSESTQVNEEERPQAKFVELVDKLPGRDLEEESKKLKPPRHPRARRKKPTWRKKAP